MRDAASLVSLPDAISDDIGCQLVAMPLSAMMLLETYCREPGAWLVQNAANGAVGKTLAVLAKNRGVDVVNIVRSDAGIGELEALGVTNTVSTAHSDWRERVKAIVKDAKVTVAIDSVGGRASADLCSVLSPGATIVAFGSMSGEPMQIRSGDLIFRQIKAEGFWLSKQNAPSPAQSTKMVGALVQQVAAGSLKLPVAGIFPLEQAGEAAAASARAGRNGKVLIRT